jgi:hypothetical protein
MRIFRCDICGGDVEGEKLLCDIANMSYWPFPRDETITHKRVDACRTCADKLFAGIREINERHEIQARAQVDAYMQTVRATYTKGTE